MRPAALVTLVRVSTTAGSRVALVAVGCAVTIVALAFAPGALSDDTPTEPVSTDPAPVVPAPVVPDQDGPPLIAAGVTIGGTLVGGLTQREAKDVVARRFARSFELVASPGLKRRITPVQLGATALIGRAVSQASRRKEGFAVPLDVRVDQGVLRRFLAKLGRQVDHRPVDATIKLVKLRPVTTKSVPGRRLKQVIAAQELTLALRKHLREPFRLPVEEIAPKVTESAVGEAIVIKRGSNELELFDGSKLKRTFRVATGQSSYPTPLGKFEIVVKQRNPWWYPPTTSAWAKGKQPVPPGPGNPLGTRWMGISSPYVGIHGTPDAASIGYSASHGCIRMLIPQVEWLFERVDVGTPVFIVAA